jgi:predicted SAM-dependent methyltransferase
MIASPSGMPVGSRAEPTVPQRARLTAQRVRSVGRRAVESVSAPLRRAYYVRERRALGAVPRQLRVWAGLDDRTAVGSRRVEIGSGSAPTPGYIHVDFDRNAPHIEYYLNSGELPFPSGWAEEILAIHVLEHVHPADLQATLIEWLRVLAPSGVLRVHVPDSHALMQAYMQAHADNRWSLMGALLGMYANPAVVRPEHLRKSCDHQVLFDASLLRDVLEEAGFVAVEDHSATRSDRHTECWRELVPQISLIFEAKRPDDDR